MSHNDLETSSLEADSSRSASMLSEVSGMDNSLSLAEIDRIIGNLIGKDVEESSRMPDADNVPSFGDMPSPHMMGGLMNNSPLPTDESMRFDDIPGVQPDAFLSPLPTGFISPKAHGHDVMNEYASVVVVSPLPQPAGLYPL
jgi:hypothetical protein